jgi:hypothetical protein
MRRYELSLFNPAGKLLMQSDKGFVPSTTGEATFTSTVRLRNGKQINNPGALCLEADIVAVGMAQPQGGSMIRVHGIGIKCVGQASNLNQQPGQKPFTFQLKAGMLKGFPLANPDQYGVIAQGQIFSAYGSWQSTEQHLELTVLPGDISPSNGIAFTWLPGETLSNALKSALSVAYSDLGAPVISMIDIFKQSYSAQPIVGWYESLDQFADYIRHLTIPLGSNFTGDPNYPGVVLGIQNAVPFAIDGSQSSKTVQLAFQDLVGQPTFIDRGMLSFKCVARFDVQMLTRVKMPLDPGRGGTTIISSLALTQQGANVPGAPARNKSIFQGDFVVNEVHHYLNSRQPDADSWCTAYTAFPSSVTS